MEFLWPAPDGAQFPCERWLPPGEVRSVLICVHGLSGAATDFVPLAEACSAAGMAVLAINVRGQGNDPLGHRRGSHLNLPDIEADLVAFASTALREFPDRPLFWCGESMGALIVCHLLASPAYRLPTAGAIFSVPVVELRKPTPAIVRQLLRILSNIVPDFRFHPSYFVNGKAAPLKITRDDEYALKVRSAPHAIKAFSLRFLNAFGDLMESSESLASRIRVPVLVLAAGCDVFITVPQIEKWFAHLAPADKTLRIYPEAYHVLWNDWDRDRVLADILAWLSEHGASENS